MGMRGTFRLIYWIIRKPKQSAFVGFVTALLIAVAAIFFGSRYVIGDLSPVDLNYPTADFNAIADYTHITGSTYSAWGSFYINKTCYYVIPKFDDNSDPKYIEQVLVVRIESKDSSAWKALSANTQKRFTHTSIDPATPVRMDAYAHNMNYEIHDNAIEYLKSIGFTNETAEKALIPYVVCYDSANKYSLLGMGGGAALISLICLFLWIKMGMNFRD